MNVIFKTPRGTGKLADWLAVIPSGTSLVVGITAFVVSFNPADSGLFDFAIRHRIAMVAVLAFVAFAGLAANVWFLLHIAPDLLAMETRRRMFGSFHRLDGSDPYGLLGATTGSGGGSPPRRWLRILVVTLAVLSAITAGVSAYASYRVSQVDKTQYLSMSEEQSCVLRDFKSNHKLLLFIHGIFGGAGPTWEQFPQLAASDERLKDFNICAIDYQTYVGRRNLDVLRTSQFIGSQLELGWNARKRYSEIDVIAHSMGGLVSRQIDILSSAGHRPLEFDKIVEIGTPHAGSPEPDKPWLSRLLHKFGYWPEAEDMEVDSTYLGQLNNEWISLRPAPVDYCIGSQQDEYVPLDSALADCPPQHTVPYNGGGHTDLVKPDGHDDLRYRTPIALLLSDGS